MAKITIDDLAIIIHKEFKNVNKELGSLKKDVGGLKKDVGGLKKDVGGLKKDVGGLKQRMVTKNYLDEKMADLRGDLVVMMRKEDNKMRKLVDILKQRELISKKDVNTILAMEPFPELDLHLGLET